MKIIEPQSWKPELQTFKEAVLEAMPKKVMM